MANRRPAASRSSPASEVGSREWVGAEFPSFESEPASRKWNLWSYIDARDGAPAAVKALAYHHPGFEALIVAADGTVMSRASADLMAEHFPGVEFRSAVEGTQALCSIDKARRLLGWTHWRNHVAS